MVKRQYNMPQLRQYGRVEHVTLQNQYGSPKIDKEIGKTDYLGWTVNDSPVGHD